MLRPRGRLTRLLKNVLPQLKALRSLDLGQDTGFGLTNWRIATIQSPLNYIRISMLNIPYLCHVMSTESLSTTLEQLRVTMRSIESRRENMIPKELVCTTPIIQA